MSRLYIGDLTDKMTLNIAKPMLMKLGRDRVTRSDISTTEAQVLKLLVKIKSATPAAISKKIKKTSQYTGHVLSILVNKGMATSKRDARERIYTPSIDAVIAYTEIE